MRIPLPLCTASLWWLRAALLPVEANATLTVDVASGKTPVSPTLYGLMTEEINHSYDGGLYAELIQNRAFLDDTLRPVHWSLIAPDGASSIALDPAQPLNAAIQTSLRLDAVGASPGRPVGIANDGFWGIPVRPNTAYQFSFYARTDVHASGPLTASLESSDGSRTFASAQVAAPGPSWTRYSAVLTTGATAPVSADNRLVISTQTAGKVWFGLVSLFPPTYADRPNGNRGDLMQLLVDLKPAFLRFPGGNYLEGGSIQDRFPWQKTLGDISQRPGHPGCWGYRSSDGMGLLEFLEWTEDMHAEPVLALDAGYSLDGEVVRAGPDLQPLVDEALDEIEYVIGAASTKWGAERAKDGHPAPFPLHFVEIGNEDFFDKSHSYDARFAQFFDAIRARYPQLKIISTVKFARDGVHSRVPDVVDRHDYKSADAFERMSPAEFDKMDRQGPRIFEGEWAAFGDKSPWAKGRDERAATSTFQAALADAAWMTAMERNSDLVIMQCYAPLLVRVERGARQWQPDLIGFDALTAYGSPSYYAFKLFSLHHGDEIVPAKLEGPPVVDIPPLHYSVTRRKSDGTLFVKVVNVSHQPEPVTLALRHAGRLSSTAKVYRLSAADVGETNSITDPTHIVPVESPVDGVSSNFTYTFPPLSINVLELPAGRD